MSSARWLSNTVRSIPRSFVGAVVTLVLTDLHPLSLEELLHTPGRPRSGANYYKEHLFIRILSHTLCNDEDEEHDFLEQIVRSSSPEPFEPEDEVEAPPEYSANDTRRSSSFLPGLSDKLRLPRKSRTEDDAEIVDVVKVPTYVDYGSGYATYVCFPPVLTFACGD